MAFARRLKAKRLGLAHIKSKRNDSKMNKSKPVPKSCDAAFGYQAKQGPDPLVLGCTTASEIGD